MFSRELTFVFHKLSMRMHVDRATFEKFSGVTSRGLKWKKKNTRAKKVYSPVNLNNLSHEDLLMNLNSLFLTIYCLI